MSYEKLGFTSGQTLKAEHLNHMEDGIANISWNDLTDKPFYSEITEGVAAFDGDLTGKEAVDCGDGITMVKITENTVTPEQLVGSTVVIKITVDGEVVEEMEQPIIEDMIHVQEITETTGAVMVALNDLPVIMTTYGDVVSAGAPFSSGTYFIYLPDGDAIVYTHSLSCLNGIQEVVHKIDKKYLPDNIARDDVIMIDVTELPTKNIDNRAIYRLTNRGYRVWSGKIDGGIVHIVDKLPEVGEPYEDNKVQYYVTTENKFYLFENGSWRGVNVKVDLIQLGTPYDEIVSGLLLDSRLYAYNNGWIEIGSKICRGSGKLSIIMNAFENQASGDYAHAEGYKTTASDSSSHAEGEETTASGITSHAEGWRTIASGRNSHAEGEETTAKGWSSHAEGEETTASGATSHAEGYHTTASGEYQHVQGKYNIEDTENKYAHIVGNGTYSSNRSNAHTLDWSGNAWYAGIVEGTAMIIKSPNGTRFQITVDDNGNLTATAITE